jgi:hypothetical protein
MNLLQTNIPPQYRHNHCYRLLPTWVLIGQYSPAEQAGRTIVPPPAPWLVHTRDLQSTHTIFAIYSMNTTPAHLCVCLIQSSSAGLQP